MKVIIYDVAAQKGGGGETILNQYFDLARKEVDKEWWFFVSIPDYLHRVGSNVHVVCVNSNKKSKLASYFIRKKYELVKFRKLLNTIRPDEVISLQNVAVYGVKCKQTVYLHQSIQFSPVKYRFLRKEERSLALRQKIVCRTIRKKLCRADKVIVQTQWMKNAVSEWAHYPAKQIVVETPLVSLSPISRETKFMKNCFIFPANANLNKNHQVLVDACRYLKKQNKNDFKIFFTLSAESKGIAQRMHEEIIKDNLQIEYVGHLGKQELYEKYQSMITLFPSYIETYGLPLAEARSLGGRIITSDTPFSHEILDGYDKAVFLPWDSPEAWAKEIAKYLI